MRERLTELFAGASREHWCDLLEGSDACFAPVLDLDEAPGHVHNRDRGVFVDVDGVAQPGPAPRFSRTVPDAPSPPPRPGADTIAGLRDWGVADARIDALVADGVVRQAA